MPTLTFEHECYNVIQHATTRPWRHLTKCMKGYPSNINPQERGGNYRPVSIISVIGKMMELIIRDQLIKHMTDHDTADNKT